MDAEGGFGASTKKPTVRIPIVLSLLASAGVLIAVALWLGAAISTANILYDIAMAVITVGLVELLLVPSFERVFWSQKAEVEEAINKLASGLSQLNRDMAEYSSQANHQLRVGEVEDGFDWLKARVRQHDDDIVTLAREVRDLGVEQKRHGPPASDDLRKGREEDIETPDG